MRKHLWIIAAFVLWAGCHSDMYNQARYEPLEKGTLFGNGMASQWPPENTIARGHLEADDHLYRGREGKEFASTFPFPITEAVLNRGEERYQIFCSPCHGAIGDGNGMIVERGFKRPTSYHVPRLREAPAGYFFDVITNGFGTMYNYRARIPAEDRWAIIAYIRVLQVSQYATLSELSPTDKAALKGVTP